MRAGALGRAVASACALFALLGPMTAAAASPGSAAAAEDRGPRPIDFAVVVDLSASLSDADLAREVEAAALLSQGEISERSRVTVIGFGSSEKSGQAPVREVCPMTTADAAGRQKLSDCVQKLRDRDGKDIGPGTDFPAGLGQAVDRLTEDDDKNTPKVVFLLTDGRLDVRDSPGYGTDPSSRQANAAKRLDEQLKRARRESVQIWPLGFGREIDRGALADMARGGYRNGCADLPGATPRMRVVDSSTKIDRALQETFAAARCAQVTQGTVGKPPATLAVTIPPIATDGSLTVSKHDRRVSVTYYDPRGRKVPEQGEFDGSKFEVSGQDGPVEALRVTNPLPGRWKVRIEAPEGLREREVAVRAIWQGRLRSAVALDPASPRAGEKAVVEVRMQTRRGVVITDPRQLSGIKVSAKVTGKGIDPVTVRLSDDGGKPDQRGGDARYTGTFTVPDGASGDLSLTGEMTAPGVTGDHRPFHTRVSSDRPALAAGVTVERATVHPGGTVEGTLDVTNDDDRPHTLRLALTDQPPGSEVRISPTTVTAPPGESSRLRFTVAFGDGIALGDVGGSIAVTDTTDDGRLLETAFLGVRAEAPPTWWERWRGAVLGGGAVVLVLAAVVTVRVMATRRRRELTGLKLELLRDGLPLATLTVRAGQASGGDFHFTVEGGPDSAPALKRGTPGSASAHRLRRTSAGVLMLRPHRGAERRLNPGEPVSLGDGLELLVRDRPTGRGDRPGGTGRTGRGDSSTPGRPPRDGRSGETAGARRWTQSRGTTAHRPAPARPGPAGADPADGADPGAPRRFDPNF